MSPIIYFIQKGCTANTSLNSATWAQGIQIPETETMGTFLFSFFFLFFYFLLDIFFIYISNVILKVPYTLPLPSSPTHPPWHSPVLGHIKFAKPKALNFLNLLLENAIHYISLSSPRSLSSSTYPTTPEYGVCHGVYLINLVSLFLTKTDFFFSPSS
jgi:hypothetical protein